MLYIHFWLDLHFQVQLEMPQLFCGFLYISTNVLAICGGKCCLQSHTQSIWVMNKNMNKW